MDYLNLWGSIILGIFGIIITFVYSHKSKSLNDDILFKELFGKFNERYDSLNDKLQRVIDDSEKSELTIKHLNEKTIQGSNKTYKQVLIDYFNLCAEEYFWNRKGRIDPIVWKSWNTGMKYWYKSKLLQNFWIEEKKNNGYESYYLEDSEKDFFNSN